MTRSLGLYMNKQINYLQHIYNRCRSLWGLFRGQHVYFSLSMMLGIIVPFSNINVIVTAVSILYLCYIGWKKTLLVFIVAVFVFLCSSAWYLYTDLHNKTNLSSGIKTIEFQIISPINLDGDKLSTIVKTSANEKLQLNYYIKTIEEKDQLTSLSIGNQCALKGSLSKPSSARNPNSFNYQTYLYRKNIHWIFQPESISISQCQKTKEGLYLYLMIKRQQGIELIERYFPLDVIGIVQALMFGERASITDEILSSYQSQGIVHLLAISGLHVGFLTGLVFFLLIRIGVTREHATTMLMMILPFYMVIAGGAPSVLRACLMTMLLLISIKWKNKLSPLDAVSIACIIILFYNPYLIFEAGFQLSFIVSYSLILSGKILKSTGHFFGMILKVTTIAQISALPVILTNFYEISLISIPLNMFFVPLYSLFILPLTLATFLSLLIFAPLGELFVLLLTYVLRITNSIVTWISSYQFGILTFGKPAFLFIGLYILSIFFLFYSWERNKNTNVALTIFLVVCVTHYFSSYLNPYGEVTVLDIGQGDTIFIRLPYQRAAYMIDVSEKLSFGKEDWQERKKSYSVSSDVVIPFLKSKGIRKLDSLIITHGDFDHIGGAATLMNEIEIKKLLLGQGNNENNLEKQIITMANKKDIPIMIVKSGDYWKIDQTIFYVLAPTGKKSSANDQSIVIFTELGGVRWLFTGDLEEEGERDLLHRFPKLEVDILKAGHHGSRTSSTELLLEHTKPKIALISVGRNNRYKHPHQEVLDRLKKHEVEIFRTDQQGGIVFKFTKKKGTFTVMIP